MKFRILVFCAVFAIALGQDSTSTAAPSTAASTASPSTAASTASPSTAASTASPSTAGSTASPSTAGSTASPSTAASTATPATTAPPTTTTNAPTTTTTQKPDNNVLGTWGIISDDPKKPGFCVAFQAKVQFSIRYGVEGDWKTAVFNVPSTANVTNNSCAHGSDQQFGLTWPSGNEIYTMNMIFKNLGDNGYSLNSIDLDYSYDAPEFNGSQQQGNGNSSNSEITFGDGEKLQSKQDAYKCLEPITIVLKNSDTGNNTDTVVLDDLNFMAFNNQEKVDEFGTATECDADFTNSDIVPIAVGCALAALVVIVLIAYLIGRKRSRQKGYQSV